MFRRILVAYDGSEGAQAALRRGIELAKALGAELASISVEEHLPHYAASISDLTSLGRARSSGPRGRSAAGPR